MRKFLIVAALFAASGCSLIKSSGVVNDEDLGRFCAAINTYCANAKDDKTVEACTFLAAACLSPEAPVDAPVAK